MTDETVLARKVLDICSSIEQRLEADSMADEAGWDTFVGMGARLVLLKAMHLKTLSHLADFDPAEITEEEVVGAQNAADVLNVFLDAHEAPWWGLVLDAVPDDDSFEDYDY